METIDKGLVIVLALLLLLSFAFTYLVKRIAHKKKLMDVPNERSSHSIATPRGGGIAIVIVWYLGLIMMFLQNSIDNKLFYALISGIFLAFISFLDDIYSLKPGIRIVFQIISVAFALFFVGDIGTIDLGFFSLNIPFYFLLPLIIVGFIWFINLYNFLDGIDAYASVEAVSIALGLFICTSSPVILVLMASVLGFLVWNWPKAKIFMGDIGSTQLGFVLFVFALYFNKTGEFNFINWLILSSIFWFDASLTIFRRWKNREKLSRPHKKHAYQRIVQAGFSHNKTVIWLFTINLILIIIAFFAEINSRFLLPGLILAIIINIIVNKLIDRKKSFR